MEHFSGITKRDGVDVGYHESPIHPSDGEGRVGKRGLNKALSFAEVVELAFKTFDADRNRANIIVKAGKNAKWYLKYCPLERVDASIKTQEWRDTSRATMYIVEWD